MIGQIIKQNMKLFFKCQDDIGWFGLGSGSIREETLHSHVSQDHEWNWAWDYGLFFKKKNSMGALLLWKSGIVMTTVAFIPFISNLEGSSLH